MLEKIDIKGFFPRVEFEREGIDYCVGVKIPVGVSEDSLKEYLVKKHEDNYGHFINDGILWRTTKQQNIPEMDTIRLYKKQNLKVIIDFKKEGMKEENN